MCTFLPLFLTLYLPDSLSNSAIFSSATNAADADTHTDARQPRLSSIRLSLPTSKVANLLIEFIYSISKGVSTTKPPFLDGPTSLYTLFPKSALINHHHQPWPTRRSTTPTFSSSSPSPRPGVPFREFGTFSHLAETSLDPFPPTWPTWSFPCWR